LPRNRTTTPPKSPISSSRKKITPEKIKIKQILMKIHKNQQKPLAKFAFRLEVKPKIW
jgi:hypothetical protein